MTTSQDTSATTSIAMRAATSSSVVVIDTAERSSGMPWPKSAVTRSIASFTTS